MNTDQQKQRAAQKAVEYIQDGMVVGLGTGSTAKFAVELLGEKVRQGMKVVGIPTSQQTAALAKQHQIPLTSFDAVQQIDLTIDGADEVDSNGYLIKGGGGALLREKIVAAASKKLMIIVDSNKWVQTLGKFPLPVEVTPFGWQATALHLERLDGAPKLRQQSDGSPFITDNQNYILDCAFEQILDVPALSQKIDAIPGVVLHGLFLNLTTHVITASESEVSVKEFS